MDKKDIVAKVERQFTIKKRKAEDEAQTRFDLACNDDEFAALVREERILEFEIGKGRHLGKNTAEQEKLLATNIKKQSAALLKMGMSPDDLQPAYNCAQCKDTGFYGGKRCVCFRNALNDELAENGNILDKNLDLSVFKPKNRQQEQVAQVLQKFLEKTATGKTKNILMSGKTGTGKTYLLNCLANEMLKLKYSVLCVSAFSFNNLLLRIHLAPIEEKTVMLDNLVATDVLVVDDLGSENKYKNVTEEYFCNVLNERIAGGKFTFLSTNLDFSALQDRYGDRIFSRLISDNTCKIKLDGADLRLTKRTKC